LRSKNFAHRPDSAVFSHAKVSLHESQAGHDEADVRLFTLERLVAVVSGCDHRRQAPGEVGLALLQLCHVPVRSARYGLDVEPARF